MKKITIAVMAAALIASLAILFIFLHGLKIPIDKTAALEKHISSVFAKFKLVDRNMIHKDVDEKAKGLRRYVSVYREYNVGQKFSFKDFESALGQCLKKTKYRIAKSSYSFAKGVESLALGVYFRNYDILSLKINRVKAVLPKISKKTKNPRIAIVIDDFGYNLNNLDTFLRIKEPLTLAVLPGLAYSREVASRAHEAGKEVILHLPLESNRKEARLEAATIKTSQSKDEIVKNLDAEIRAMSYVMGVSNHMGSKATEDAPFMNTVLSYLKGRKLYFFDSLTSEKSVVGSVASNVGAKYAARDFFLDNSKEPEYIKQQILALRKFAFKNGEAAAVCHDRATTAKVLAEMIPELSREGVKFVKLSELVK